MYESFFGLKEKPFRMTPDTRYFYPSEKHVDALNHMVYAIEERRGFVVITGEIGSGKTTLSRVLFQKLDPRTKTAIIRNTHLSAKDLISAALDELEIPYKPEHTKTHLIGLLNEFLIDQLEATNQQYLEFARQLNFSLPQHLAATNGQLPAGGEQLPIWGLGYVQALYFSLWSGKRIPSTPV
jgi:general secretion pathway protein A